MSSHQEESEKGHLEEPQQEQQQLDYYGQQQTNLGAATAASQYNDLANNPELAQLLQQEASKQAAMGMPYGMMGNPMIGLNGSGMYRMPQEIMQMPIGMMEEEPLYVNAKQYNRILKRRQARAKIDAMIRASKTAAGEKAPYMHESRHRHAMKRPRGPGGRFLTAPEIAALKAKEAKERAAGGAAGGEEKVETDSNGSSSAAEPNNKAKPTKA